MGGIGARRTRQWSREAIGEDSMESLTIADRLSFDIKRGLVEILVRKIEDKGCQSFSGR